MLAYVINLDSAVDRRRRMEGLLDALGLQFEVVQAVDGRTLTKAELSQFDHHDNMSLGFAEYGCLLSHVKCWGRFLQSTAETALVCEDDIHFSSNFLECIATLHVPLNEIYLIRLETFLATVTVVRRPVQKEKKYSVFTMLTSHGGTGIYAINRTTANYLMSVYKQMRHAIDIELFAPDRRSIPPFVVYQMIPAPCAQDHTLAGPSGERFLQSGMGNDRADIQGGLLKASSDKRVVEIAKTLLRPVYRLLLSLVLGLSGKRRIKVRYR
jgi:glycosyl transferase, family 25